MIGPPVLGYEILSKEYNVTLCKTVTQFNCETNNKIKSRRFSVSEEDCPLECVQTLYDSKINNGNYPSMSYCELLATQSNALNKFRLPNGTLAATDMTFRSTFSIVSIHFRNSWFTQIETSLQITPDLLVGLLGK